MKITIAVASLLTPEPAKDVQGLIEHARYPHMRGDIDTQAT